MYVSMVYQHHGS